MGLVNKKTKVEDLSFLDILDYAFNLKVDKDLQVIKVDKEVLDGITKINTVYNGIIFTATENEVHFSFPDSFNKDESITLDKTAGNILNLIAFNDAVYLFCEKAVMKITASGKAEEFTLKKLDLLVNGIKKDSILLVGDRIVLVINNTLCYFKNDKITVVKTLYDGKIDFVGKAYEKEGRYEYQFSCTLFNEKQVKLNYLPFSETVYLSFDKEPYFKSKKLCFSTDALKSIEEISFNTTGEVVMIISTDTTLKRYTLKKGEKVIKPYLKCRAFRIEFLLKEAKNIKDLKIKYAI
ncbi:MAG: hypothetical protein E7342_00180 [Clostridiales bacterium]|nr:hypothetical protein [Clostridiales bacterium]